MPVFEWRSVMPVPADELFAYHARPGAFERLAPPWQKLRVLEQSGGMTGRRRVVFDVCVGPVEAPLGGGDGRRHARAGSSSTGRWKARSPPGSTRTASCPSTTRQSELLDHVEYSLPAGGLTDSVGEGPAGKTLSRLFRFRHERTRLDLERHARVGRPAAAQGGDRRRERADRLHLADVPDHGRPRGRQARAAAGGRAGRGHLGSRRPDASYPAPSTASTPSSTSPARHRSRLWTPGRKKAILEQPRAGDRHARRGDRRAWTRRPRCFVYAVRGGRLRLARRRRRSPSRRPLGEGFLADVCRAWEAAAEPGADAGVRVVTPRFGIVMSAAGGALAKMLPAFKAGLGGASATASSGGAGSTSTICSPRRVGSARRRARAARSTSRRPSRVTNREFTRDAGSRAAPPGCAGGAPLRPCATGSAAWATRCSWPASALLPMRLKERGFRFAFPELEGALRYELGRCRRAGGAGGAPRRGAARLSTRSPPRGRCRRAA